MKTKIQEHVPAKPKPGGEKHLRRVRRVCSGLPGTVEKISHGAPTFFAGKVYCMFVNNHHDDGHVAIWIPAARGMQEALIEEAPETYFRPPYVGVKGWVGVELGSVSDETLEIHLREAWKMIAPKKLQEPALRTGSRKKPSATRGT